MILNIDNIDKLNLDSFCDGLIKYMQENAAGLIDIDKLETYDNILSKSITGLYTDRIIKAINLYNSSMYILKGIKVGNDYKILFDENINIPNSITKYIDMIKLINFGNLSVNGCHIYDKLMEKIASDLSIYYDIYLKENA